MDKTCQNKDMIKYLADNADTVSAFEALHHFINFVDDQDDKFMSSPAYPSYTGLGEKAPVKIQKVGFTPDPIGAGIKKPKIQIKNRIG